MFNVKFGEWVFVSWEMRKCMKEYFRRKTIWVKSIFKRKHGMFQVRNLVWLKRSNWGTESVWQVGRARSQRILSTRLRFHNALADEMQTVDNLAPFPFYHSLPTPPPPAPIPNQVWEAEHYTFQNLYSKDLDQIHHWVAIV